MTTAPATVTVTIRPDLSRWRAGNRLIVASSAYSGSLVGVAAADAFAAGDGTATNAQRTDARDTYYTALDAWEAVQ